jgi:SulP family sulfate permease
VILRIDGELFFANSRWFRETVRSLAYDKTPPVREVLVHAGAMGHVDTTAAAMLAELIAELLENDVELHFARVTTSLHADLGRNGILDLVGPDHFHETVAAGVDHFLARNAERPGPPAATESD